MLPSGCLLPHLNCIISPFCISADSDLAYVEISVASLKLAERPEAQSSLLLLIKDGQVVHEAVVDRGFSRYAVLAPELFVKLRCNLSNSGPCVASEWYIQLIF